MESSPLLERLWEERRGPVCGLWGFQLRLPMQGNVHLCGSLHNTRSHLHTKDTHGWMHCNTHVSAFIPSCGAHSPTHTFTGMHPATHVRPCTTSRRACVSNTHKGTEQACQHVHTHAPGPLHNVSTLRAAHTHSQGHVHTLAHTHTLLYYTDTLMLLLFRLQVISDSS